MWNNFKLPKLTSNLLSKLKFIENKKNMVDALYDVDGYRRYYEYIDIKHITASLNTEGTYISEEQTRLIMNKTMPNPITYKSFIECNNLCNAVQYMNELVYNNMFLDYNILLQLHKILSASLLNEHNSGKIRTQKVFIGNGNYEPAQINQIDKLLKKLFLTINEIDNPIVKASYFSYNLVSIHPFIDFNGRLSRLCESYILMYYKHPVITLKEENIQQYMNLIREGQEKVYSINLPYINFIADMVIERLDEMLS